MAIYVTDNAAIGNYNVALNFVVLITFFATPVTTMMFPAFSKLDALKDKDTLKNVFQFSVKYASIIIVPVTFMVMVLAQPAIATIFQNKYVEAPLFLALLSITYIYTAFGNLSASNLINGQGYTTFNLILTILTAAIGFPLGFVLISTYGIMGLIITSLVAGLPSLFVSLYFVKKHFQVSVDWVSSTKIIFSSGIAALLTYLLITQAAVSNLIQFLLGGLAKYVSISQMVLFVLSNLILLGIGLIAFVILFVLIAVVTKTINLSDINNIREIVNSLAPLRKLLGALINVIERLMKLIPY
jgi:O-antigen/teichoic acid export membrane protein